MNVKQLELLNYLKNEDDWITSSQLSLKLNVSLRSIKNYISEIKKINSDLIISSKNGYKVNKSELQSFLKKVNSLVVQTPEERIDYIIMKLVKTNEKYIDVYDLSEEMYVSDATIKADLYKVKHKCYEFDLTVVINSNNVSLEGSEKNKRKIMSSILYNNLSNNPMNISTIQNIFIDYDAEQIEMIIEDVFKEHHYFINNYSLTNLVLHIIVTLDRIKNNCISDYVAEDNKIMVKPHEYEIACEIAKRLENVYHIKYNGNEIYELSLLIVSSGLTEMDYKNINKFNLEQVVGKECIELVRNLIEYISSDYYIEFKKPEFLVRFALHIKNLLVRCKSKHYSRNPLTDSIKSNCPLIYDCAVNVSYKIKTAIGYEIDEDEIAYIALHIGCALENEKNIHNQITCAVLFPQYYDLDIKLAHDISSAFQDILLVKHIVTNENELQNIHVDFIVSTIRFKNIANIPFVIINPFLTERDRNLISNKIDEIKKNKQKLQFLNYLKSIFNGSLFLKDKYFENENDAIDFMCDEMQRNGYINADFKQEVLEREAMSSTAFNGIAIPHSMRMDAIKTGMFVIVNQHPMKWGKQQVNIIFLLTINKNERKVFYNMFDSLTTILSNEANLKKIIQCDSFEKFINTIVECV